MSNPPPKPERHPGLLSEVASAPGKALSWWEQRKTRHEQLQQLKSSGMIPSWGWTPAPKPKQPERAISEPAVPAVRGEAVEPKSQRDLEWAKVGGLLEGIAEGKAAGEREKSPTSPTSPTSSEFRPASAPAATDSELERRAEREKLERYSLMDSI